MALYWLATSIPELAHLSLVSAERVVSLVQRRIDKESSWRLWLELCTVLITSGIGGLGGGFAVVFACRAIGVSPNAIFFVGLVVGAAIPWFIFRHVYYRR